MTSRFAQCAVVSLGLCLGCKASVHGEASASTSGEANANLTTDSPDEGEIHDFDKPIDPSVDTTVGAEPEPADVAPIGARQDLMFKGPGTLECRCMSVALGPGNHPAFDWGGGAPKTSPSTQLVIGFSSKSCEGAPSGVKASYWGYEVKGDDVVVVVENSHEGRPVTVGAIIPKPMGDGKVYLRPLDDSVPFAGDSSGRCELGNPGPKRTSPGGAGSDTGIRLGDPSADETSP